MKKYYLPFIILLIGITTSVFFNIHKKQDFTQTEAEFTSVELWKQQFQKKKEKRKIGYSKADKPNMFSKYFKDITTRIGEEKSAYEMNYKITELRKAKQRYKNLKSTKETLPWIQRGPANIGGRTRGLIIDPDDADHNTWYAGAASGGIWKTIDGGNTWTNLSDEFSNLSVNAMAMPASNSNIIYAGTGESFPGGAHIAGNGIWKSSDKGVTWTQLSSTATDENFAFINRIVINSGNEDEILVATETGIFKTINAGVDWEQVYSSAKGIEDLVPDPECPDTLYAGENSVGIVRSFDGGDTWTVTSTGLGMGTRFEVAVSPVNHDYLFTSVHVSSTVSDVYISKDNAHTWTKFNSTQNFLGGQGNYDNAIEAHPYNTNEVFVGGVDMWKLVFNGDTIESQPDVLNAYAENTTFLSFVKFGGDYLDGGLADDQGTNLVDDDWVSVEIRFGTGISQKAHRFTVPSGSTSGVAASAYSYVDYVEVPFEVWDITNNKQLMVSFRDQENDGKFNLYERTGENYGELGREYIFVNSIEYNQTTPDANITVNGGHVYKNLYFTWATLTAGVTWEPDNLPESKIVVNYGSMQLHNGERACIADAYGNWGGANRYNQSAGFGEEFIPGLHPDHHNITVIPLGEGNFKIINANDGGLAISNDNGNIFTQLPDNYITTQFYGVAKSPEANEYFGGMQDNGTWQSHSGEDASNISRYLFRTGGDGFECLWHAEDPGLMLGSTYYNKIYRSQTNGQYWSGVYGITKDDGPFITRLSASKENPDMVFAVGKNGVYKSTNFGKDWVLKAINSNWATDNVTSKHNVEVSLANGSIVWAGAAMAESGKLQMQVSTNEGNSFSTVNDYSEVTMNAYVSGIATHPIEDSTAYVLFSLSKYPKILRTTNLGETWEDISGFGTNTESSNGFPDVIIHCLLVLSHESNTIWVGTDIGLFESNDNGSTWHIASNGLPQVCVYDMHVVGDQIVVATHGRGIWSVTIPEINYIPYISDFEHQSGYDFNINIDIKVEYDSLLVYLNENKNTTVQNPSTGVNDIPVTVESGGHYTAYVLGYINGNPYKSNLKYNNLDVTGIKILTNTNKSLSIYPNPCNGTINFDINNMQGQEYLLEIYNIEGQKLYSTKKYNLGHNTVSIESVKSGLYIVHVSIGNEIYTQRIQVVK